MNKWISVNERLPERELLERMHRFPKISLLKPDAVTRAEVERLINFLRPVLHTSLPDCFVQAVALLTRPYHRLTEQQAAVIRKMAMENDCDVLEDCCTGQQYTWGVADGSVQLMPLKGRL